MKAVQWSACLLACLKPVAIAHRKCTSIRQSLHECREKTTERMHRWAHPSPAGAHVDKARAQGRAAEGASLLAWTHEEACGSGW